MTDRGEPGLLCDDDFSAAVAGVLFDAESRQLCIEFADMDSIDLNIPVEEDYIQPMLYSQFVQIGTLRDGVLTSSRQVPVLFLNDPYGVAASPPPKASSSVLQFESFMKRCVAGQPIHRDDLGDEEKMDSVMSGANAAALQFAPQLARQRTMEAAPRGPAPKGPAPSSPGGPGGMSGMSGMGGGGSTMPPRRPASDDDQDW